MKDTLKKLKIRFSRLTALNIVFLFALLILFVGIIVEALKLLILVGLFLIGLYVLFWSGWVARWFKNN